MKNTLYTHVYFVGIGGIGMSALARYFNKRGYKVAGYDKTSTPLTEQLSSEGIAIHYEDLGAEISPLLSTPEKTLVVYTPAVPSSLQEFQFLQKEKYSILKRAAVLGKITEGYKTLAVAGTHGKTTTSTLLSYVLRNSAGGCNAFLGGISANFNSNLLMDKNSEIMVVEADEYDRSFLKLKPFSAIITSVEADHLDIYENVGNMVQAFEEFASLVDTKGYIIRHKNAEIQCSAPSLTYAIGKNDKVDYQGVNLRIEDNHFVMDVQTPTKLYEKVVLGLPGIHNAENALAVIALCETLGIKLEEIRASLASFKGVERRFEYHFKSDRLVYIDDYAHHPTAIKNLLDSIHILYKDWPVYLIFQPHLYSRTRDFMEEFAQELSQAENVILLPIYPARELPIEGITSDNLATKITSKVKVVEKDKVLDFVSTIKEGVILTVGAGDISTLVKPLKDKLS